MKKKLSEKELGELHGGTMMTNPEDVVNLNSADSCRCTYLNAPSVTNTNTTEQCVCKCISSNLTANIK